MPYLTHTEYNDLDFTEIDETEFNRLIGKASDALDGATRNFYVFNSLENDGTFRKKQFKKAVACQVEYFHEMGASSSHGLNEPSTVQIGRTSMSTGSKGSQQAPSNSIVSKDVYMYLEFTGLLYRGIGVS